MTAPIEVAEWMFAQVLKFGALDQDDAVGNIPRLFGPGFTYDNDAGNPAINKAVLSAFRKLTGDAVTWDRAARHWRRRDATDPPGRQQN